MNKRIQELADRCHHRYSQHNIDLEKFAELIIDMCADHIMDTSDRYRKEYFAAKVLELKQ